MLRRDLLNVVDRFPYTDRNQNPRPAAVAVAAAAHVSQDREIGTERTAEIGQATLQTIQHSWACMCAHVCRTNINVHVQSWMTAWEAEVLEGLGFVSGKGHSNDVDMEEKGTERGEREREDNCPL